MTRLLAALVAAGALLAGCSLSGVSTTTKSGDVGDTLSDGGLRVTVLKVDGHVPRPERDITGLATPSPGTRFVGVKAKACTDRDQAVKAYDFQLRPVDGDSVRPRTPVTAYSQALGVVRSGCGTGWLVFQLASGVRAQAVKFAYDDTGSGGQGGGKEKHARFTWELRG